MKKYMIEREIPKIGTLEREQLQRELRPSPIRCCASLGRTFSGWNPLLTADKMFCVYLAQMSRSSTSTQN